MTEDEAKLKWCPAIRLTADGLGEWHTNRSAPEGASPGDPTSYRCIGSACMAWRRQRSEMDDDGYVNDAPPGSGFCGLAGSAQ